MEEYEKRRERLKAMRLEAAQAGLNNAPGPSSLPSGGLSNPLIESETISTAPLENNPPRFDFYTDPMAAFSGNKRRNNISPQVKQGNFNIPQRTPYQGIIPGPLHQNLAINSPHQSPYQAPVTHFNQGPPRSPMETAGPFGRPQGNPMQPRGGSGGTFHSTPHNFYRGSDFASPSFGHGDQGPPRGRMEGSSPFSRPQGNPPGWYQIPPRSQMEGVSSFNRTQGNPVPPGTWGGSDGAINYSSPSFGCGGSPVSSGRGRSQRHVNSSHYRPRHEGSQFTDSGRGRGGYRNSGLGFSGRRGGRSHGSISAELRPDLYYNKEMVEDPWRRLSPVTWKGIELEEQYSKPSWLPESIRLKKTKASPEVSNISIHRPSLAEYLAASFNDPTKEPEPEPEPVDDQGT